MLHLENLFHSYILEDAVSTRHLVVSLSPLCLLIPHNNVIRFILSLDEGLRGYCFSVEVSLVNRGAELQPLMVSR